MKIKSWMMYLINYEKKSSVLNPRPTQLKNMADEVTLRLLKFLIVFLVTT